MATISSFPSNTIQLWQYHVANPISIAEQHYSALPQHEQLHAAAFADPLHRAQFILCRQFLREKLATFIPTKPSHIPIILSPTGKPSIRESNIQFNQSHRTNSQTGMLALFAISGDGQVGIDIDNTTLPINFDRIIEDQFANTEQQNLLQLSPELRRASFFKMWTQKEAYLKCLGTGLSQALNTFEIPTTGLHELPKSIETSSPLLINNIRIHSWQVDECHVGSLAYISPVECDIKYHIIRI